MRYFHCFITFNITVGLYIDICIYLDVQYTMIKIKYDITHHFPYLFMQQTTGRIFLFNAVQNVALTQAS